ncbi:MalY/PatB family protein [Patulibacter sp. S7RM1-6]
MAAPEPAVDLTVPPLERLAARRSAKWAQAPAGALASTIAEMDFPVPAPVTAALRAAIEAADLGYVPSRPAGLGAAFAGFAARRWGWEDVEPEHVAVLPDVVTGLVELLRALPHVGREVAVVTPAYPPFLEQLPSSGLRVRPLPSPDGTTPLDALDAALADGVRAVVLANPHNPTGRVLARAELAAIAERCAAAGAWVLADEIHGPLTLGDAAHVPWLTVSDAARACGVALTSASKAFNVAGLKTALLITAPGPARDAVGGLPDLSSRASILGVRATAAAFADGDAYLDALLSRLTANRALLAERLRAELPAVRWRPPDGTYLAWLDCRALGLGDDPAAAFLERGRVALSPGPTYGPPGAGHVRLNFGTSPELVAETVRRMASAL